MLDYADLFVSNGDKPQFTSKKAKSGTNEEKDPFDDMMKEAQTEEHKAGSLDPESFKSTQVKPDGPLQQKAGPYLGNKGNFQKGSSYQPHTQGGHRNHGNTNYRSHAAANFAAFDEEDEEPEWNDFDPEKETGNFFGREIPDET